jgi:hypothetical protein
VGPDATNGDHHPHVRTEPLEGHKRPGIGVGQLTSGTLVGRGTSQGGSVGRCLSSGSVNG